MTDQRPASILSSSLDEVSRRRADLYETIIALEQAAARPAVGREDAWTETLLDALDELRPELVEHVTSTEQPDGLYAEIAEAAPRLIHRTDLLREEHRVMLAELAALTDRVRAVATADAGSVERAREDVRKLLGLLVRHRQHGADLVWEAFNRDIGENG